MKSDDHPRRYHRGLRAQRNGSPPRRIDQAPVPRDDPALAARLARGLRSGAGGGFFVLNRYEFTGEVHAVAQAHQLQKTGWDSGSWKLSITGGTVLSYKTYI